jgi:hypothetical protein
MSPKNLGLAEMNLRLLSHFVFAFTAVDQTRIAGMDRTKEFQKLLQKVTKGEQKVSKQLASSCFRA